MHIYIYICIRICTYILRYMKINEISHLRKDFRPDEYIVIILLWYLYTHTPTRVVGTYVYCKGSTMRFYLSLSHPPFHFFSEFFNIATPFLSDTVQKPIGKTIDAKLRRVLLSPLINLVHVFLDFILSNTSDRQPAGISLQEVHWRSFIRNVQNTGSIWKEIKR